MLLVSPIVKTRALGTREGQARRRARGAGSKSAAYTRIAEPRTGTHAHPTPTYHTGHLVLLGNEVRERLPTIEDDDKGARRIEDVIVSGLQRFHGPRDHVRKQLPQPLQALPVLCKALLIAQELDQAQGARELAGIRLVVLGQAHRNQPILLLHHLVAQQVP